MKFKIFLVGGFGNNLFQIALGDYLEAKGIDVIYNDILVRKNIFTKLLKWSIHGDHLTRMITKHKKVENHLGFLDLIFLFKELLIKRLFDKEHFIFDESILNSKFARYYGYCMIGNHLTPCALKKFRINAINYLNIKIDSGIKNDVVMHCRRGDYGKDSRLSVLYYKKILANYDETIYLTSDNVDCLDELIQVTNNKVVTNDQSTVEQDFATLCRSKILIASNSTFSYWAHVLGNQDLVYFPDRQTQNRPWFYTCIDNKKVIFVKALFENEVTNL